MSDKGSLDDVYQIYEDCLRRLYIAEGKLLAVDLRGGEYHQLANYLNQGLARVQQQLRISQSDITQGNEGRFFMDFDVVDWSLEAKNE